MPRTAVTFGSLSSRKNSRTKIPLSSEQEAVVEWAQTGGGNAHVEAVAGSGKTHTLLAAVPYIKGRGAFCVFNKRNADETTSKLRQLQTTNVQCATDHSHGFRAWRRFLGDSTTVSVDARRKSQLMCEAVGAPRDLWSALRESVSLGKQTLYGVLWGLKSDQEDTDIISEIDQWKNLIYFYGVDLKVPYKNNDWRYTVDSLVNYARQAMQWSMNDQTSVIDFNDMIWLPILHNARFEQFDFVMQDEAQDTNAARRVLKQRMIKNETGRLLSVGDRHQAIYGFTGADSNAVSEIVEEFNCEVFPLSTTFRCSKKATELARQWVPQISAHETNLEGSVSYLDAERLPTILEPGDAVLCRLKAPLVSQALELVRRGIAVEVLGRDIGKGIQSLITRWNADNLRQLSNRLRQYLYEESARLGDQGRDYEIESLKDRVDTAFVLMDGAETIGEVLKRIDSLFNSTQCRDRVLFSTVHKSKGLEWDRVFILGFRQLMPSLRATKEWELEQEKNLQYVAVTRCKNHLVLVDL